jgi:hypothetical protein
MGNYLTKIGDATVLLEAPASSAFAKGGNDVETDPRAAILNMVRTIKTVSAYMGSELMPVVRATGAAMEVSFNVRADMYGLVMISESTGVGQFQCTVRFNPPPPMPPPPRPPMGAGGPPPGMGGPPPGMGGPPPGMGGPPPGMGGPPPGRPPGT